jgi:integrase
VASVHERGGKWVVKWRVGGRGSRQRSLTRATERAAHALAEEIERALERDGVYEPARRVGPAPMSQVLDEYIADCARRLQPGTVHKIAISLRVFREWLGPGVGVDAWSFRTLSDFQVHLSGNGRHGRPRAHNTVVKCFEHVETAWKWAWKRGTRGDYVGVPPPDSLELRAQPEDHKQAPTFTQMDDVIEVSEGWQRDLYVVLRCTGLRVQQAMGLRWDDFQLDREPAVLHLRGELGKSDQERRGRYIPISPVLVSEFAGWGRREGWLLECGRSGRVARARDAGRAWARAGIPAEVWERCPHHAFRAGFQSGLKRLKADDEAVRFLVGHSIGVRAHYLDPAALPLVEAVGLLPPIGEATDHNVRRIDQR